MKSLKTAVFPFASIMALAATGSVLPATRPPHTTSASYRGPLGTGDTWSHRPTRESPGDLQLRHRYHALRQVRSPQGISGFARDPTRIGKR
jgi:hypothetical protein